MPPTPEQPAWHIRSMHHLGLTVGDLDRSVHFYRDLLGMELIRQRPRVTADYVSQQTGYAGVALRVASLRMSPSSPQTLEIVQYLNHAGPSAELATNQAGSSHLCLVVDDLQSCHAALAGRGVRFKSEPVRITAGPNAGGQVVYFLDPDGYTLELFEPPDDGKGSSAGQEKLPKPGAEQSNETRDGHGAV